MSSFHDENLSILDDDLIDSSSGSDDLPDIYSLNGGYQTQGTLLNVEDPTFFYQDVFCSFNKCKKACSKFVNTALSVVFTCFITGKTLDCLTPIYQTEKLFNNRFGGDNYPDLVKCVVYFFIGSDVFISVGALFLAKSRNRYIEKMKKIVNLVRGKQPLLLDLDKLSYASVLTSRNHAKLFVRDLEQKSVRDIIKGRRRDDLQGFVLDWMDRNQVDPRFIIKDDVNAILTGDDLNLREDVSWKITDYILTQANYPYKLSRLTYGFFNICVYCLYTWLKWDSLKGGITVFFGDVIPKKVVEIICISCLGAAWFYDIGAYLKNGDAIFRGIFKINNEDIFYKYQNQRARFWFRMLSVCNLTSTFLYWQTVEHDFGKEGAYLKMIKAFSGFYVNLCTKNYSLWPLLQGYFSSSSNLMHQFGEQQDYKFNLLWIKALFYFGVVLSFLRVFSKSGLSTIETSFTGSIDTLNMFPGINIEDTQEIFYQTLCIGIPFAFVNMLINWSWKTGPVLGQFMSGLSAMEMKLIQKAADDKASASGLCAAFRSCCITKGVKEDAGQDDNQSSIGGRPGSIYDPMHDDGVVIL